MVSQKAAISAKCPCKISWSGVRIVDHNMANRWLQIVDSRNTCKRLVSLCDRLLKAKAAIDSYSTIPTRSAIVEELVDKWQQDLDDNKTDPNMAAIQNAIEQACGRGYLEGLAYVAESFKKKLVEYETALEEQKKDSKQEDGRSAHFRHRRSEDTMEDLAMIMENEGGNEGPMQRDVAMENHMTLDKTAGQYMMGKRARISMTTRREKMPKICSMMAHYVLR